MAKYSFQDLTDVLGGKKKLAVIAGITSVAFLFGGCLSSVARLARRSSAAIATTAETTVDPKVALCGTYYGHNGSVLILKDDGNADYFYSGQNDVKHSNTWSLNDNEITINMSWLFCTVKGTVESDPTSFVLAGSTDLDDILWDDERFEQVSTDTPAMTKAECEAFISEHQSVASGEVTASAETSEQTPSGTVNEYSSSVNAANLNVTFVDIGTLSLPVPSELTMTSNTNDSGAEMKMYSGTNKAFAIAYVPADHVVGDEELDELGDIFISSFLEGVGGGSVTDTTRYLVGGYPAIEHSATTSINGTVITVKSIMIDRSQEGYMAVILTGYDSLNNYMLDYYHYAISIMQGAEPASAGTAAASETQSTTTGSSSVREVLDQYETFMNEYIAFMQNYYNATPNQMVNMLDDYYDLLTEYDEMMDLLDSLDTSNMTAEDYAYYLEVTNRVNENLMSLYNTMGG